MVRTQIILPSSGVVDLYDDVNVSYNFNAADIREPEKGVADFTKTIILPGTKNNNKLFHNQFDINLDSVWDTRKKLSCIIVVDDVEIMRGYMRLMRIIQKGNNDYDYEVTVIGNTASIFKDVGGDELTALDISRLDHIYNNTNIVASWSAPVGVGYVYPFMDMGRSVFNPNSLVVEDWTPCIYVKEYLDRIFEYYGYQYESTFFTSSPFKNLIIPCDSDGLKLNAATIATMQFRVSRESSGQALTAVVGTETLLDNNDDTSGSNTNPGGIYSLAADRFTVVNSGYLSFYVNATVRLNFDQATTPTQGGTFTTKHAVNLRIFNASGVQKAVVSSQIYTLSNALEAAQSVSGANLTSNIILTTQSYFFDAGDYIEVYYRYITTNVFNCNFTINSMSYMPGSYYNNIVSNGFLASGNTILANNLIPKKIKISDFLAGIKKLFNLYFSIDKDITNKYIIEPRDDWYTADIVDWSGKLDISKDVEIIPMGDLDSKRYIFQYRKDEDYYNSFYQDKYQETYGTRKLTIDTDFVKSDYVIEPIYSQSPLHSDTRNDRVYVLVIPKSGIRTVNAEVKHNIRILYYGGLKSCQQWEFPKGTLFTTYPYAGHLDDPINPNVDLCYGIPKEVYYLAVQLGCTYTNNNLYNVYWRNLIDEISDKNSRIVIAYFNLTPADINQLDARKIYYFRENHWRLNKIMDYNPLNNSTTKCEFTKIKTSETAFN